MPLLCSLNIEFRILVTSKPRLNSFSKRVEVKALNVKKHTNSLSKLFAVYEKNAESLLDETDVDSYFN